MAKVTKYGMTVLSNIPLEATVKAKAEIISITTEAEAEAMLQAILQAKATVTTTGKKALYLYVFTATTEAKAEALLQANARQAEAGLPVLSEAEAEAIQAKITEAGIIRGMADKLIQAGLLKGITVDDKLLDKAFHSDYRQWKRYHVTGDMLLSEAEAKAKRQDYNKELSEKKAIASQQALTKAGLTAIQGRPYEIIVHCLNEMAISVGNIAELLDIQSRVTGLVNFHHESIEAYFTAREEKAEAGMTKATVTISEAEAKLENIKIAKRKTARHGGDIVTDK